MVFSSPAFLFLFLPAALSLWWWAVGQGRVRAAQWLLIATSIAFYAFWNAWHLPILAGFILGNYAAGQALARRPSKPLLAGAIAGNLFLLGTFKYLGFFTSAVNDLTGSTWSVFSLALPLGISFVTFQAIAYLVDSYRGVAPRGSLRRFALFLVFFPQLVAGPIVHHGDFAPQTRWLPSWDWSRAARGLLLLWIGLAKKVLIADPLGSLVDPLWASAGQLNLIEAWLALLGYSLQLYFDFSAYGEMAIGLGLLFGFTLPINFNSPYKATTISDFWRRWHITLSTWLRDYLYIPLGGSRQGFARGLAATATTMLLGGLWHGASWTFLAWGALHAAYIAIYRLWEALRPAPLPTPFAHGLTLLAVVLAWLPFRAPSFEVAGQLLATLAGVSPTAFAGFTSPAVMSIPLVLALCALVLRAPNAVEIADRFDARRPAHRFLSHAATAGAVLCVGTAGQFLYWSF